jgi:hypothetical protein
MAPRLLAAVVLLGSCAAVMAEEPKGVGDKVVAYCQQQKGKQVGEGECSNLAESALAAAGAKGRGPGNPGPDDYTWGTLVLSLRREGAELKADGRREDVRPGDIVQFRDTRWESAGQWMEAGHHTAVVVAVENKGQTLRILHQNWGGQKTVVDGTLRLGELVRGWIRVYRPVPADGGPTGQPPAGQIPPGQLPAGQIPPGQIPPGQLPAGQIPLGQIPPGLMTPFPERPGQLGGQDKPPRGAMEATEDELRAALTSPVQEQRLAALYAIGERRLFWTDELIPLLKDDSEAMRQMARRSLVVLGFYKLNPEAALPGSGKPAAPTRRPVAPRDFGPPIGASRTAQEKAVQAWSAWWKEQENKGQEKTAPDTPTAKPGPTTGQPRKDVPEADQLCDALVKASPPRQGELLKKYAEGEGAEYTLAIARAIAKLDGQPRQEARDALAERLSGRTEPTLLRYLGHDDAEVRRAAALALAMRDAQETVPEVAKLLLDPEPSVSRAAHAALRSLTGEDYGPPANATEREKQEAVKRYQAWRPRK